MTPGCPTCSAIAALLGLTAQAEPAPAARFIDQDSVEELARMRLSRRRFLEGARSEAFPSSKRGRQVRANLDDVDRWLSQGRRPPRAKLAAVEQLDPTTAARQAVADAARRFLRRGAK